MGNNSVICAVRENIVDGICLSNIRLKSCSGLDKSCGFKYRRCNGMERSNRRSRYWCNGCWTLLVILLYYAVAVCNGSNKKKGGDAMQECVDAYERMLSVPQ